MKFRSETTGYVIFYSETKGHVTFHSGSSMWSITLRPTVTWNFIRRGTWIFTQAKGHWIFTLIGTSGFTQNKGHLKFQFVTKQQVIFVCETKVHVNWTFTTRQWVHGVGNLRRVSHNKWSLHNAYKSFIYNTWKTRSTGQQLRQNLNLVQEHCVVHFSFLRIVWRDLSRKY